MLVFKYILNKSPPTFRDIVVMSWLGPHSQVNTGYVNPIILSICQPKIKAVYDG